MSDGHCFILWHNGAKVSIPPVLPILYSSNVEIWISFFPDEKHKVKKRTSKRKRLCFCLITAKMAVV